jgi:hypothetical protein
MQTVTPTVAPPGSDARARVIRRFHVATEDGQVRSAAGESSVATTAEIPALDDGDLWA